MEDELQRSTIEDQVANFGQASIQVLCKKHPRKEPSNFFFTSVIVLK
jgi:hypothetical protein